MQLTRYPVARAPIVIGAMVGTFAVATGLGVAYLSAPGVVEVPIEAAPASVGYPAPTVVPSPNPGTASLTEKRKSTKRRARQRKPRPRRAARRSPRRSVTAAVAPAAPTAVATPTATATPVATAAPVRRPAQRPKPKPKATPAPTFDSSG